MLHHLISALILVSNLQIYDPLLYEKGSLKNFSYPSVADIFTYFYLNNTYQHWLVKIGVRVVN